MFKYVHQMFTNHEPVQISYLIYVYMITTVLRWGDIPKM